MKNLLAFTAFLAAGYLLGSRRACKPVVIEVVSRLRGADLVATSQGHPYRTRVAN